jgi:RNA polymerase sigma-70 factor (ECF subfamily)
MDERRCVDRLREGDESAFELVYRAHADSLFRYALRMCGSSEAAEEALQEVFLALIRGAGRYDAAKGSLGNWLFGAMRRQVFRQLGDPGEVDLDGEHAAPGTDPLAALSRSRQAERVRQAVMELPPAFREVVVLCEMEEMTYEAAAERIGCPVGTVRSRLSRARALLGRRLEQAGVVSV